MDGLGRSGDDDINEYSEEAQFGKQWGWYQSIYAIAQGDVGRFDNVTRMGLLKCLTYLTFEKQKNEIESRKIKRSIK